MTKPSEDPGVQAILAKLSAKREEMKSCEIRLSTLRSEVSTLTDALNLIRGQPVRSTRKSLPDHVEEVLREAKMALPLEILLSRLAEKGVHTNAQNVTGALGRYVREGKRFTRPARSTFGLAEHNNDEE